MSLLLTLRVENGQEIMVVMRLGNDASQTQTCVPHIRTKAQCVKAVLGHSSVLC